MSFRGSNMIFNEPIFVVILQAMPTKTSIGFLLYQS